MTPGVPLSGPGGVGPEPMEGHVVRLVPGLRASKGYTCPDCGNDIPPGQGHVVAWPEHDPDLRRHWHRHCWRMAVRRGRIA